MKAAPLADDLGQPVDDAKPRISFVIKKNRLRWFGRADWVKHCVMIELVGTRQVIQGRLVRLCKVGHKDFRPLPVKNKW